MLQFEVAEAKVQHGDINNALTLAAQLINPRYADSTYTIISHSQIAAADFAAAISTVDHIQHPETRLFAQQQIAIAYAKTGEAARALDVARQIETLPDRNRTYSYIARNHATHGRQTQAQEAAALISDDSNISKTDLQKLIPIITLASTGNTTEALEATRQLALNNPVTLFHQAQLEVAKGLLKTGHLEKAFELAKAVPVSPSRDHTFLTLTRHYLQADVPDKALQTASFINDPRLTQTVQKELIHHHLHAGDLASLVSAARYHQHNRRYLRSLRSNSLPLQAG